MSRDGGEPGTLALTLLHYETLNVPPRYHIRGRRAADIAASVEAGIREGAIATGSQLPTVRGLATRLGVSVTTVAAAYRELRLRGHVAGAGRLGTTVVPRGPMAPRGRPRLPAGVRDLTGGNPDPLLLPDLEPYLTALHPGHVMYGVEPSNPELLRIAALHLRADRVGADHLTVVGGALDGIERVLSAHLRPGDRVAVEDPCYAGVADLVAALGLVAVPVAIDDRGPDSAGLAEALGAGVIACLITPRAQNPYGSSLDEGRAAELRAVLRRHPNVLVVEDDHAFGITEEPGVTVCVEGRSVLWAHVRSVSKSLGPDLRVAVLAGDATTVARVEGRRLLGAGWVSHLLQQLTVTLWRDTVASQLLATATTTYARRREALLAALAERGIDAHGRSGLNVWIPVAHEDATVSALLERGWGVLAGERFRIGSGRAIRVTTSILEPEESPRFAADLEAALAPAPSRLG